MFILRKYLQNQIQIVANPAVASKNHAYQQSYQIFTKLKQHDLEKILRANYSKKVCIKNRQIHFQPFSKNSKISHNLTIQ